MKLALQHSSTDTGLFCVLGSTLESSGVPYRALDGLAGGLGEPSRVLILVNACHGSRDVAATLAEGVEEGSGGFLGELSGVLYRDLDALSTGHGELNEWLIHGHECHDSRAPFVEWGTNNLTGSGFDPKIHGSFGVARDDTRSPAAARHLDQIVRNYVGEERSVGVRALFQSARGESFEDGMSSAFSEALCIRMRGMTAMDWDRLESVVLFRETDSSVAAEALRWIGRDDTASTHDRRLGLLLRCLTSPSVMIRDGALLGISSLNDACAIVALKDALVHEEHEELRRDLASVLADLESANS